MSCLSWNPAFQGGVYNPSFWWSWWELSLESDCWDMCQKGAHSFWLLPQEGCYLVPAVIAAGPGLGLAGWATAPGLGVCLVLVLHEGDCHWWSPRWQHPCSVLHHQPGLSLGYDIMVGCLLPLRQLLHRHFDYRWHLLYAQGYHFSWSWRWNYCGLRFSTC